MGLAPADPYLSAFPHFAPSAAYDAPGDIDVALRDALATDGHFVLEQRLFDLFAWQTFLALARPGATPVWEGWLSTAELADLSCARSRNLAEQAAPRDPARLRPLSIVSIQTGADLRRAMADTSVKNAPLVDRNGNFTYFETLLDPAQITYLCDNKLITAAGQRAFLTVPGHRIDFPAGLPGVSWSGTFGIKLAWRILDSLKGDDPRRFYTRQANVQDLSAAGGVYTHTVTVGLVAAHIVRKTASAPDRIWATFEQVDNLAVDRIENPGVLASYVNPDCEICARNQPFPPAERHPTQLARVVPISAETEALNAEVHSAMKANAAPWQYYKLIGVQWPGISGDPRSATPKLLSNVVMEAFIQPTLARGDEDATGCMTCHSQAASTDFTFYPSASFR